MTLVVVGAGKVGRGWWQRVNVSSDGDGSGGMLVAVGGVISVDNGGSSGASAEVGVVVQWWRVIGKMERENPSPSSTFSLHHFHREDECTRANNTSIHCVLDFYVGVRNCGATSGNKTQHLFGGGAVGPSHSPWRTPPMPGTARVLHSNPS